VVLSGREKGVQRGSLSLWPGSSLSEAKRQGGALSCSASAKRGHVSGG
jgi:hypothetical protein